MTIEKQQAIIARARHARAETVSALAASAARVLWNQGLRLRRAWMVVRTRSELHALSDRMLRDIGVSRDQIDSLVR
jgi:uncharacterized protein YjiS (DUF1127 family)